MNRRSLAYIDFSRLDLPTLRAQTGCSAGRARLRLKEPVRRGGTGYPTSAALKYSRDFAHFDYVNVDAPKGGAARQVTLGTFDNFNVVVAETKGTLAARR